MVVDMLHLSMSIRTSVVLSAVLVGLTACGDDPAEPGEPIPEVDAGAKPEDARVTDTGTKPVDTGTATPGENATLTALAGRYLVRFDNFGTAVSSGFTIRSRVSVLVAAELAVDGAQLTARERVCNQTVLQECKASSCQASTTVVDAKAVGDFMVKRTFARLYTVAGANFSAGKAVYALGYDDPADGNAPDGPTDARVWDVIKGAEPREGLLTKVTVTAAPLPPISCNVYGTQKFVSQFSGALSGSGASASFPAAALEPVLNGSDANQLGSDNPLCAPAQEPTATDESASVRFARFGDALGKGETWDCPSNAEFDSKLPGGAL